MSLSETLLFPEIHSTVASSRPRTMKQIQEENQDINRHKKENQELPAEMFALEQSMTEDIKQKTYTV